MQENEKVAVVDESAEKLEYLRMQAKFSREGQEKVTVDSKVFGDAHRAKMLAAEEAAKKTKLDALKAKRAASRLAAKA